MIFPIFCIFSFKFFITTLICFVRAGHVLTHFWSEDLSEGELVNETIWPIALSDVRDTALYIVLLISFSSLLLFPLYFFFLFISFSSFFLFPLYFFFLLISFSSLFLFPLYFWSLFLFFQWHLWSHLLVWFFDMTIKHDGTHPHHVIVRKLNMLLLDQLGFRKTHSPAQPESWSWFWSGMCPFN